MGVLLETGSDREETYQWASSGVESTFQLEPVKGAAPFGISERDVMAKVNLCLVVPSNQSNEISLFQINMHGHMWRLVWLQRRARGRPQVGLKGSD